MEKVALGEGLQKRRWRESRDKVFLEKVRTRRAGRFDGAPFGWMIWWKLWRLTFAGTGWRGLAG